MVFQVKNEIEKIAPPLIFVWPIENRKLVLVGGKNGSNQKMSENKKFLIISVNLNPKCQVPNPKIAFYQNTLPMINKIMEYDFFNRDNMPN